MAGSHRSLHCMIGGCGVPIVLPFCLHMLGTKWFGRWDLSLSLSLSAQWHLKWGKPRIESKAQLPQIPRRCNKFFLSYFAHTLHPKVSAPIIEGTLSIPVIVIVQHYMYNIVYMSTSTNPNEEYDSRACCVLNPYESLMNYWSRNPHKDIVHIRCIHFIVYGHLDWPTKVKVASITLKNNVQAQIVGYHLPRHSLGFFCAYANVWNTIKHEHVEIGI